jgi:hypothetical protein
VSFESPPNLAEQLARPPTTWIVAADPHLPRSSRSYQHRQSEGLRVLAFLDDAGRGRLNEGWSRPIALERLVRLAWQSWQKPAPRYLLNAGTLASIASCRGWGCWSRARDAYRALVLATVLRPPVFTLADDDLLPDLAWPLARAHAESSTAMVSRHSR